MDCNIRIDLICEAAGSGETDATAEFYGSFAYRVDGQSSWTTLVQNSDSSTWNLKPENTTEGGRGESSTRVAERTISVPSSAKFIEVQGSLKEYDPTIFDADEDLGTRTISVPIVPGFSQGQAVQGDSYLGQARWVVSLTPH